MHELIEVGSEALQSTNAKILYLPSSFVCFGVSRILMVYISVVQLWTTSKFKE